jgi:hypothetical protein
MRIIVVQHTPPHIHTRTYCANVNPHARTKQHATTTRTYQHTFTLTLTHRIQCTAPIVSRHYTQHMSHSTPTIPHTYTPDQTLDSLRPSDQTQYTSQTPDITHEITIDHKIRPNISQSPMTHHDLTTRNHYTWCMAHLMQYL